MNFDPISPGPDSHVAVSPALNDYEETVRSTNPLRAAFIYWRTEALIDIRRDVAGANSINRSVRQYTVGHK